MTRKKKQTKRRNQKKIIPIEASVVQKVLEMGLTIMIDGTVYDRQGHKLGKILM
jgi:hypothetical protein